MSKRPRTVTYDLTSTLVVLTCDGRRFSFNSDTVSFVKPEPVVGDPKLNALLKIEVSVGTFEEAKRIPELQARSDGKHKSSIRKLRD